MRLGIYFAQTIFLRFFINYKSNDEFFLYADGPLVGILRDIEKQLNFSMDILMCQTIGCEHELSNETLYNVLHSDRLIGFAFDKTLINNNVKFVMLNIQCT